MKIDTEDFMTEMTRTALENVLKKFPRKKITFKELIGEYGMQKMSEVNETIGLEVLEILDSLSYTRVLRLKEMEYQKAKQLSLQQAMDDFLRMNNDLYYAVDQVPDCYLICKKIKIKVQHKNENNVFQPYEKLTEQDYMIIFIVKLSENYEPTPLIKDFLMRGCKMVKIYAVDTVTDIMGSIR